MTSRLVSLICLTLLNSTAGAAEPAAIQTAASDTVEMPALVIVGTPAQEQKLPGSAQVIDSETLEKSRVYSTNEALRKVAGLNVRDEEGFGLRPNIGIRGLNPTRSTKILLLEDGIPLTFAPYGGNESYYHPPVERFDRIEVLKGAGQNIYGPQTVGGVINYITPAPPTDFGGRVSLAGGNRGYLNGRLSVGEEGLLFDAIHKQSDGARDNIESEVTDVNLKGVFDFGASHSLTARANSYTERSQVTYSGLTDAEVANFGLRYNPFKNDDFDVDRLGASLTHEWSLAKDAQFLTNLYYNTVQRDWWRQASSTTDGQCGFAAARAAGTAVDPDTCASNQGRLREYYTYGLEPRLTLAHGWLGLRNELITGVRVHLESQDRLQKDGASSAARDGVALRESNERLAQAYSAFIQNTFGFDRWSLTPSLRAENIRYERINRCPNANGTTPQLPAACTAPVSGKKDFTELIPGLGATFEISEKTTAFAGVHRGFAPPRVEDVINGAGTSVDLDSEDSVNAELGLRSRPTIGLSLEAVAFRNDFHRQIAVGNIAGGNVPLATGKTLYEGLELAGRADFGPIANVAMNPFFELALTWLPTAEQSTALRRVDNGNVASGSVTGNRLPYAPKLTVTSSIGIEPFQGFSTRIEAVHVGRQFSDFANNENPVTADGLTGAIASHTVLNAAANYTILPTGLTLFVTGKNLLDRDYIVDRTRGILPGSPLLVQAGAEYRF